MNKVKTKASALLFVLVMLFIVTLLANVVLRIMLNQSRLSRHRIWRAQALYAAQAGTVLAMEQLRSNTWRYGETACINCAPGTIINHAVVDHIVEDPDLIPYIVKIRIFNIDEDPPGAPPVMPNCAPIRITVNYQRADVF